MIFAVQTRRDRAEYRTSSPHYPDHASHPTLSHLFDFMPHQLLLRPIGDLGVSRIVRGTTGVLTHYEQNPNQ